MSRHYKLYVALIKKLKPFCGTFLPEPLLPLPKISFYNEIPLMLYIYYAL